MVEVDIRKAYLPTATHYYEKPLHLKKASMQNVWDADGRKYLDAIGGIVCIASGHNHPRIKKALQQGLDEDLIQHTSYLYDQGPVRKATKKLLSYAPDKISRVGFTNSGSEANEMALLSARTAKQNLTIVHLEHSYHGGTSTTLGHCGHSGWKFNHQPAQANIALKAPYCYRCPFGKKRETCALDCVKNAKETLETMTHGKIAGFIAEPIMGVGGFITPSKEYFYEMFELTKKFAGMYISDEVQTGVGRTGKEFFYSKEIGIEPDMITLAKSLGNGAPIGAILGTEDAFDKLKGKTHFNTFGGDPYQTLQALTNIEIIEEEGLIAHASAMGEHLFEGLHELKREFHLIGDIRGKGLLQGVELVKDLNSKEYATEEALTIMESMRERGILIGRGGLKGNVLRLAPPYCVQKSDIEEIIEGLRYSFGHLQSA